MGTLLKIGCGIAGALVLLAALAVGGILYLLYQWGQPHLWHETRSAGGQEAYLAHPAGSMERIYYSIGVKRHRARCTAVTLRGHDAPDWLRLAWQGETLVVRYGLPADAEARKVVTPARATGEHACPPDVQVRLVADPGLVHAPRPEEAPMPDGTAREPSPTPTATTAPPSPRR